MLDHVAIPVSDVELFGTDDGMVALRQSEEVIPLHVAFRTDRAGVHSFHETALAAGAPDNGPPGIRSDIHEHYYAAFVLDPDS